MWKKLAVVVAVLFAPVKSACAETVFAVVNGNELYSRCGTLSSGTAAPFCQGYVLGIIDYVNLIRSVNSKEHSYCAPDNVTLIQSVDIVRQYLEKHPENRNKPATMIVLSSLNAAFPCPK